MKPKVLHVITVYNGRSFVPAAIKSAVEMDQGHALIDVLVLDDASPDPGWSEELSRICDELGALYYCSPRNLGIPRNVSLGLLTAIKKNYDYVTINNSDVIFPKNLISIMVEACKADRVGSVTAWSNNVSIYSIPNADPDRYLANQATVDFICDSLHGKYGSSVFDAPAGISFCIMMPVEVVKKVGLMDPIFGRGYCEETDWSLRSLKMGYRVCICPGTFVYHQGRGSNVAAGLVSGAHTTVPENEVIIDTRFPDFRKQCDVFVSSGLIDKYRGEAVDHILNEAARSFGYCILPGWGDDAYQQYSSKMRVEILPEGSGASMAFTYAGFTQTWPLDGMRSIDSILERFGSKNLIFNGFEKTVHVAQVEEPYPQHVW